jgi:uncharacterized protein (TIGR02001 family)
MKKIISSLTLLTAIASNSAFAQEEESDWSLDGFVGVATDYRDRGLSVSDRDFTAHGSIGLFHSSGFSGGMDLAGISDGLGSDVRTEFFAGYSMDNGDYVYDFSVELDVFHGDSSRYYPEFKAAISRDFGLAFIRGGIAFAPDGRWSSPDLDSYYTFADLEIPVPTIPELTLMTHIGYDARDGASDLLDWSVGLSAFVQNFEVTLAFEDSSLDRSISNGQVVLGAKFYF